MIVMGLSVRGDHCFLHLWFFLQTQVIVPPSFKAGLLWWMCNDCWAAILGHVLSCTQSYVLSGSYHGHLFRFSCSLIPGKSEWVHASAERLSYCSRRQKSLQVMEGQYHDSWQTSKSLGFVVSSNLSHASSVHNQSTQDCKNITMLCPSGCKAVLQDLRSQQRSKMVNWVEW